MNDALQVDRGKNPTLGRSLTDDFKHMYKPSRESSRDALKSGVIVLDANVLLNVLRYSRLAREELLAAIETVGPRCFIPHQIALEFHRNRVDVVKGRAKELNIKRADFNSQQEEFTRTINQMRNRRMISAERYSTLAEGADELFSEAKDSVDEIKEEYDLDPRAMIGNTDPISVRLEKALEGRVAVAPSEDTLNKARAEASRRKKEQIPPGFKDENGGDYLWWSEVIHAPELSGEKLLIVSDDATKGDWIYELDGIRVGPLGSLVSEFESAGGAGLWFATTHEFLSMASEVGITEVSSSTLEESEGKLGQNVSEWTIEGYLRLLSELEREGYSERAAVITEAAISGAFIERSEVYRITQEDELERSLRRFASPVRRITRNLQSEGIVGFEVEHALEARYEGPGKTIGYSVPEEFTWIVESLNYIEGYADQGPVLEWDSPEAAPFKEWREELDGVEDVRSGVIFLLGHVGGVPGNVERAADLILQ